MSRPRSVALRPPISMAVSLAIRLGVLGCAVLLTGCAAKQAAAPQAEVAPPRMARVEIEDDGLPAQLAPRNRRPGTDDPSQPWSPNYGTGLSVEKPRAAGGLASQRQATTVSPQPADTAASLAAARQVLARMQEQPDPAAPPASPRAFAPTPAAAPQPAVTAQAADQAAALANARRVLATMQAQKTQTEKAQTEKTQTEKTPPARMSGVDEDTLVRRAIAEHEMRRAD